MIRKALILLAALIVVGTACVGWFFLGRGWEFQWRAVDGTLLFAEHISSGPGTVYSAAENAEMTRQIDVIRFVTDARKRAEFPALLWFGSEVGVGEAAPEFELRTVGGEVLRLSDLRGKNAVFMFAAMTCPPARAQTPRLEALRAKYDPEDVVFFLIYSRERHPGEPGFREFSYAKNDAEKRAYAQMLSELTTLPIAVDDFDESVLKLYGEVPNAAYVLDPEGTIVFRSTWADSRKVEQVLDKLLEFQGATGT